MSIAEGGYMAARIHKDHLQQTRDKIQTTQLLKRLQDHALGSVDIEPSRIRAIEILLRKTLPDLSQVALTGESGGPVEFRSSSVSDDDLARIATGGA